MALIKCPECGREKVSDSAETCPDCGYGIKAHFDRIRQEEERKEKDRQAEIAKRQAEIEEENRIKSIPKPQKPQLKEPIIEFIISIVWFCFGIWGLSASNGEVERSLSKGNGDPHLYGGMSLFLCIVFLVFGIRSLTKSIERYNLSRYDLEAYQKMIAKEEDKAIADARAKAYAKASAQAKPECPYCHSRNTEKISTASKVVSVGMVGVASSKIGKQWHCNNCRSDF